MRIRINDGLDVVGIIGYQFSAITCVAGLSTLPNELNPLNY